MIAMVWEVLSMQREETRPVTRRLATPIRGQMGWRKTIRLLRRSRQTRLSVNAALSSLWSCKCVAQMLQSF